MPLWRVNKSLWKAFFTEGKRERQVNLGRAGGKYLWPFRERRLTGNKRECLQLFQLSGLGTERSSHKSFWNKDWAVTSNLWQLDYYSLKFHNLLFLKHGHMPCHNQSTSIFKIGQGLYTKYTNWHLTFLGNLSSTFNCTELAKNLENSKNSSKNAQVLRLMLFTHKNIALRLGFS